MNTTYTPKASSSGDGPGITVYANVPEMTVIVNENNNIRHHDIAYAPGEEVLLDGPTALSLVQSGYVTIKEES